MRWYRAFKMWYLQHCISMCDAALSKPDGMGDKWYASVKRDRKYFEEEFNRLEKSLSNE